MDQQDLEGTTPGAALTPEQTALLQHLGLPSTEGITRAQAAALISQAEEDPAYRERLQAWHRDKPRLHPDLFTPPQRSFREARWWQSQISGDNLYGYSFRQPSINQTLVILDSLDRQEPGWEREGKNRRTARFMNELATLSPELCKPGCSYPHELPAEDSSEPAEPSPVPPPCAPSAPFVPGAVASPGFTPPTPPSQPAWNPSAVPLSTAAPPPGRGAPSTRRGGGWILWLLLLVAAGIVGTVGYVRSHRDASAPSAHVDVPSPAPANPMVAPSSPAAGVYTPLAAADSRQRALAKHPDLGKVGSPLNAKFVAAYHILESQHSPRLLQPDWPERLADEFAGDPSPAPVAFKPNAASPPSATPRTGASPVPAAPRAPSAPPVPPTVAAATTPAVAPSLPAEHLFVSLEAAYKNKVNTVKYGQHGAPQEAAVAVDVHSMMKSGAKFMVRCVFFKRPNGRTDLRSVLSSAEKHFEVAAGQTYSDAFDSPPVYRGRGATEEFDGWLVQLFPEGSDRFVKQIGSTGTIEELGKRTKF